MGKQNVNLDAIRDDILSPGKIIWQQKSGSEVVISAKHSFLNLTMIEKLQNGGHNVFIEDDNETLVHSEFVEYFQKMEECLHIKDKIVYRNKFINLLLKNYINSQRSQDDLNQLAWKLFSKINRNEARSFLDRDINFFKRGMSVASSFTFCAFLMGHYDNKFLCDLYTSTFTNLMKIGNDVLINSLKERLEELRGKPHFDESDRSFIKTIVDVENHKQVLLLEKFDGSGLMSIENEDLSKLEMIICSLNYFFHWNQEYEGKNLLSDISEGRFRINVKIVNLIKENISVAIKDLVVAA